MGETRSSSAWRAAGLVLAVHLLLVSVLLVRSRGDPTVLLCVGEGAALPSGVSEPTRFAGRNGYDGQFYGLVALDPLDRAGTSRFVDDPGRRLGRILLPALAALAGARDLRSAAVVFLCANLSATVLVALLVFASASRCSDAAVRSSLSFPFVAAVAAGAQTGFSVAVSRGLPGPPGAALVLLGLSLRGRGRLLAAAFVLALAPLDHEIFALAPLALAATGTLRRRLGRGLWILCLLPAVLWRGYLHARGFPGAVPFADVGIPLVAALRLGAESLRFGGFLPEDLFALLHLACFLLLPLLVRGPLAAPFLGLWIAAAFADRDVWMSFWSAARATAPAFVLAAAAGETRATFLALGAASFSVVLPVWFALFPPVLLPI